MNVGRGAGRHKAETRLDELQTTAHDRSLQLHGTGCEDAAP